MAAKCSWCRSLSTYDQGDKYACETCGGSTFYTGERAAAPTSPEYQEA